ncbi:uncharacterized protein LOC130284812 [Hyla sarda]|uniref:uncharacterized protein LOC130284812 n=1 Tax=Hyla sarda TaxID=327740 RepID=UPI0024C42A32|nr:uncharacterized protein LOC130284812 [Hyla sarda]
MAGSIGIFSRSGEDEYRWLMDGLRGKWSVSPFVITNRNYSVFCEEIYRRSFGILYHSRNRGRVNITDVTDSLYDREVRTMSEALGRDRVIAVIDDLDDSSDEARRRILDHQPTLRTHTNGIFLFTPNDKANREVLRRKIEAIIRTISTSVRTTIIENPTPVYVPEQGPDDTRRPQKGNMKRIVISLLSCFVFWNTYYSPTYGNGLISVLWALVTGRMFYTHVSKPVLPLALQQRFALSCAITLMTIYETYHRPSAYNVAVSVLWIASCVMYSWPESQKFINAPIRRPLFYGMVLITFWKGWQQSDDETTLQTIYRGFLRSPAILAAEVITDRMIQSSIGLLRR